MAHDWFWLDGRRSDMYGIHLQGPITFSQTSPKVEPLSVPGRNGTLHYFDGSYENVTGKASCFVLGKNMVPQALSAIAKWTMLEPGCHRLETTDEIEYFRLASVVSGPETEIRIKTIAPFSIEFDCGPQKFLKSGERPLRVASGMKMINHWFPSLPLISVSGAGEGTLTIGKYTIQFLDTFSGPLTFDCESQNAFTGTDNKNGEIKTEAMVRLESGENEIQFSGGVESVTITPRWWTL